MTTDMTLIQNQLPANVREQLAAQVALDIERLGAIGGKDAIRVTQDKKFEMPNGDVLDELEVVIVDFVYRNEFYLGAFNRKDIKPPACFAINANSNALTPSAKSPMKQSDGSCEDCQQNEYGSSPQGDGKACKNTVYMAVLPTNAVQESPIWTVKSSPTAIRHFNSYVSKIARTVNAPISAVTTRIFFDPASTFASLRFEPLGVNPVLEATQPRIGEARDRLMQEPDVTGFVMPGSAKK